MSLRQQLQRAFASRSGNAVAALCLGTWQTLSALGIGQTLTVLLAA